LYQVIIIEDDDDTSGLLTEYLQSRLGRLIEAPGNHGHLTERSEPDRSQLYHLRRGVEILADEIGMGWDLPQAHPVVQKFHPPRLMKLQSAVRGYTPQPGPLQDESLSAAAVRRAVAEGAIRPEILIVDLAIGGDEGDAMEEAGCFDEYTGQDDLPLRDPRRELELTTGFKLLRAFVGIPVLVTSRMTNPLIAQHCLVNGAFAYLRKPPGHRDFQRRTQDIRRMAINAQDDANAVDVVVNHYLTSMASEVLKAISYLYHDHGSLLDARRNHAHELGNNRARRWGPLI
jgi:hypothetical protein